MTIRRPARLALVCWVALSGTRALAAANDSGAPALQSVPFEIPFQGYLTDPSGDPVGVRTPQNVALTARLYDAPTGGTLLWGPEPHAAVTVEDGVFEMQLGSTVSFPPGLFGPTALYLEIQVNSEHPMPRTQLSSTPFALRAGSTDNEPGVAFARDETVIPMTPGQVDVLISRSITVPTSGYVLALGEASLYVGATSTLAAIGLSQSPSTFLGAQEVDWLSSGAQYAPIHVSAVFEVPAGTHTFYMIGTLSGGSMTVGDLGLSLVFLPTAYGIVDGIAARQGHGSENAVVFPPGLEIGPGKAR